MIQTWFKRFVLNLSKCQDRLRASFSITHNKHAVDLPFVILTICSMSLWWRNVAKITISTHILYGCWSRIYYTKASCNWKKSFLFCLFFSPEVEIIMLSISASRRERKQQHNNNNKRKFLSWISPCIAQDLELLSLIHFYCYTVLFIYLFVYISIYLFIYSCKRKSKEFLLKGLIDMFLWRE